MTQVDAFVSNLKPNSLLSYVVQEIVEDGTILTETAILDLLTTLTPSQITGMSSSAAIVADKIAPLQAVLRQFSEPIETLAQKTLDIPVLGGEVTLERAFQSDLPVDFILASFRMPPEVCRWYVLANLSNTGEIWPAESAALQADTEFDLRHLWESVHLYLTDARIDRTWVDIFGLAGMISVVPDKISNTRELIESLRAFLSIRNIESPFWAGKFDDQTGAYNEISRICKRYGVQELVHFRQVSESDEAVAELVRISRPYAKTMVERGVTLEIAVDALASSVKNDLLRALK